MTHSKAQQIFALLLTLVFLIVSPLLLLYASGFRFDFFSDGLKPQIRATGGIRITPPNQYQITLNNITEGNTPLYQEGLDVGTVSLKLSQLGFQPWIKELPIEPYRVTLVDSVILFPETPEITLIENSPSRIQKILPNPVSDNVLYSSISENQAGLWIYNPQTEVHLQLVDTLNQLELGTETAFDDIIWDGSSQQLSFSIYGETGQRVFIVQNILTSQPQLQELTDLFPIRPIDSKITIISLDGSTLTYLQDQSIYQTDTNFTNKAQLILQNVAVPIVFGSTIYYQDVRTDDVIRYNILSRQSETLITEFEKPINSLHIPETESHLLVVTDTFEVYRMTLDDIENRLVRRIPNVSGQKVIFGAQGKKVLLQGQKSIHILYLDDFESYQRYQKGDVVEIYLANDGSVISFSKYFGPNEEHVLFIEDKQLSVVELDTRDTPNFYRLISNVDAVTDVLFGTQSVIVYLNNNNLNRFQFPIRRATLF